MSLLEQVNSRPWGNINGNRAEAAAEPRVNRPPNRRNNAENENLNNEMLKRNKSCMDKFRKNGKLEMPFKAKIEETYMYHGHGSTVCDINGKPVIKTVPHNCVYITQTICGITNNLDDKVIQAFCDERNQHIWLDPIKHIRELREIVSKSGPALHIHMPGCSFVETSYYPISDFPQARHHSGDTVKDFVISGLLPLSKALTIPLDNPILYTRAIRVKNEKINTEFVKTLFEYSIYPKIEEKAKNKIPARPLNSIIVYKDENGTMSIKDLKGQGERLSSNPARYVSELMGKFPGVHFNFLCRSIVGPCLKKAPKSFTRRRRHSALLQNTLYNTIRKQARQNISLETNLNQRDTNITAFLNAVQPELTKNLAELYDVYSAVETVGLKKSKAILQSLFEAEFEKQMNELFTNKAETDEFERVLNSITTPIQYIDQGRHEFEYSLLQKMAMKALEEIRDDVVLLLCRKGVVLEWLETLTVENIMTELKATREQAEIYYEQFQQCKETREQALRNASDSSNESNSERNGGGKRKTRRRK